MPGANLKGWGLFLLVTGLASLGIYIIFVNSLSFEDELKLALNSPAAKWMRTWFYVSIGAAIAGCIVWVIGLFMQASNPQQVRNGPSVSAKPKPSVDARLTELHAEYKAEFRREPTVHRQNAEHAECEAGEVWSSMSMDGIAIRYRDLNGTVIVKFTGSMEAFKRAGRLFNPFL